MQEPKPQAEATGAASFAFLIPTPLSKKNNMVRKRRGRRVRTVPSDEVVLQENRIAGIAAAAMQRAGLELDELADFSVSIEYAFGEEFVRVTCTRLGSPPKVNGRTGRRRDLQNLGDSILDALQGVTFHNDNQVAALYYRRVPHFERS